MVDDNKQAQRANELTQWLIKLAALATKAVAEGQLKFLTIPLIKQAFEYIVEQLMQKLSILIQEDLTVLIINFQTEAEKNAFNAAMEKLKSIPIEGDPNAISDALKKAKEAMDNLGHWDGSAVPK